MDNNNKQPRNNALLKPKKPKLFICRSVPFRFLHVVVYILYFVLWTFYSPYFAFSCCVFFLLSLFFCLSFCLRDHYAIEPSTSNKLRGQLNKVCVFLYGCHLILSVIHHWRVAFFCAKCVQRVCARYFDFAHALSTLQRIHFCLFIHSFILSLKKTAKTTTNCEEREMLLQCNIVLSSFSILSFERHCGFQSW